MARLSLLALTLVLVLMPLVAAQPRLAAKARALQRGNRIAKALGQRALINLLRESQRRRCSLRLCFALDGSSSISGNDWKNQQDLVKLMATLADFGGSTSSAVQYGLANVAISSQTGNDAAFRRAVDASVLKKASRTFIGAGLGFCGSTLLRESRGDGRKIVVLGDGRSNIFTLSLSLVKAGLKDIKVYAVGIGFPRNSRTLIDVAGASNRVYNVRRYGDLKKIVPRLLRALCGPPKRGGRGRRGPSPLSIE